MPQRLVLLVVVASFILVILALGVASIFVDRSLVLDRAERNAVTLARLLDAHASATLNGAHLMLAYLAHAIAREGDANAVGRRITDWAEVQDFAQAMPPLGTIWVFSPDGRILFASAPTPPPPPPYDLPELSYFATPGLADTGVVIGRLREGPDGPFFTISKAVPVPGGGGVVMAAVSSVPFVEFYRTLDLAEHSFVALMYRSEEIVATPWPRRLLGRPLPPSMLADADGLRWEELGGEPYVIAWRQLGRSELTVLAALSKEDLLEGWTASLRRNALLGAVAAVILAGITVVALASLRREERSRAALDKALREKETLFKELHHRVKNNLQVVTSLVTMQSLRFPQPELQESFQQTLDRVRAMGLVHELLYQQEDSERLEFGRYLSALIATLADSHGTEARGIAIDCEADEGTIDLHTAIPAGLIVNELLTNALKYAYPDGHGGRIVVAFARQGSHCNLSISDDGVGYVPTHKARGTGLGSMIVKNLAAQLSAGYSVDSSPGAGTRVSLTFPCPS